MCSQVQWCRLARLLPGFGRRPVTQYAGCVSVLRTWQLAPLKVAVLPRDRQTDKKGDRETEREAQTEGTVFHDLSSELKCHHSRIVVLVMEIPAPNAAWRAAPQSVSTTGDPNNSGLARPLPRPRQALLPLLHQVEMQNRVIQTHLGADGAPGVSPCGPVNWRQVIHLCTPSIRRWDRHGTVTGTEQPQPLLFKKEKTRKHSGVAGPQRFCRLSCHILEVLHEDSRLRFPGGFLHGSGCHPLSCWPLTPSHCSFLIKGDV